MLEKRFVKRKVVLRGNEHRFIMYRVMYMLLTTKPSHLKKMFGTVVFIIRLSVESTSNLLFFLKKNKIYLTEICNHIKAF